MLLFWCQLVPESLDFKTISLSHAVEQRDNRSCLFLTRVRSRHTPVLEGQAPPTLAKSSARCPIHDSEDTIGRVEGKSRRPPPLLPHVLGRQSFQNTSSLELLLLVAPSPLSLGKALHPQQLSLTRCLWLLNSCCIHNINNRNSLRRRRQVVRESVRRSSSRAS